jgi:hypothetical protein
MVEGNTGQHPEIEDYAARFAYLTNQGGGGYGASEREAEVMLRDDDLWLVPDWARSTSEGEKAVEEWKEAHRIAADLVEFAIANIGNRALIQLVYDAEGRAEEAFRRARERVSQAREEG